MAEAFLRSKVGTGAKSIEKAVITLDRPKFTNDGDEHAPKVQLVMLGETPLVEGQDYFAFVTPATTAGTYRASVVGVMNYGGAASVEWHIDKAQGTISVEPQSVSITGAIGTSTTVQLTYKGDGEITFGESEYVSLSREGNTVTVTSKAEGSGHVTITLEDGQNYKGATAELGVEVSTLHEADPVFANNSWKTIAAYCAAGEIPETWQSGDTKPFNVFGVDEGEYEAQIIGKNHDDLDPTDPMYGDPSYNGGTNKAAITLQFRKSLKNRYAMHSSNDNSVSWEKCTMRTEKMPQLLSSIDPELAAVLRIVTKKAPQAQENATLVSTADKLFLLGPYEVFASPSYTVAKEGEQYEYYKSGNSTVKELLGGSASTWWLRCPASGGAGYFCNVNYNGNSNSNNAAGTNGVAAGFCI